METTITFHLNEEDKKILKNKANQEKLSLSSYVRFHILKINSPEEKE